MKIKELIKELEKIDPERTVVISRDAEGNGYSPLHNISTCSYEAQTTWYGEIGLEKEELTEELRKQGYTEEDIIDGEPAIVLWPTN